MAIIRWNPWNELFSLQNQMDEIFNATRGRDFGRSFASEASHLPVDIRQTDESFIIEASVPGLTPDDVEVTLDEGLLTVRGMRSEKKDDTVGEYVRRERRTTSVFRQIALPQQVRADDVTATFANGVLTITVPREQKAQPKRIPINGATAAEVVDVEAKQPAR